MGKELERCRRGYCITDGFLQELDKTAGSSRNNMATIQKRGMNYVLKTGANWAWTDQKLSPDDRERKCARRLFAQMVSTESAQRTLYLNAADFAPSRDLKVLFLGISRAAVECA